MGSAGSPPGIPEPPHEGQTPVPAQAGHFGSGESNCVLMPLP